MPLTHDEREALLAIKREVSDIHGDMADFKAKLVLHGQDIRAHQVHLERHEYRIGALEVHAGIGPVGAIVAVQQNPMVDPKGRRARLQTPLSMPPKSAEELGLQVTDSGTTWKTKDVGAVLRRFEEQEQQRLGAEQALELERKKSDRRLKNFATIAGLVVLVVGSAVGAITYLYTHVTVDVGQPKR